MKKKAKAKAVSKKTVLKKVSTKKVSAKKTIVKKPIVKKAVTRKVTVRVPASTKREYIVTKPINWGFTKRTLNVGDILTYDTETRQVEHRGELFNNCQDFTIMLNLLEYRPEKTMMLPYNKNSTEAKAIIAKALKDRTTKRKGDPFTMPVEKSDRDIIAEINIADTQIGRIDQRKKEAARQALAEQKKTPMAVVADTSRSIEDIVSSQNKRNPLEGMKVVKDDGSHSATGPTFGSLKKSGSGGGMAFTPTRKAK